MEDASEKLDVKIAEKLNTLQVSSRQDMLTGLWNQAYLREKVDAYVEAGLNKGTLFLINIDNFGAVNENYGHIMGDACLVEFAEILKSSFRDNDIEARLSGDEFAVFLGGKLSSKDVESIANKLMDATSAGFVSMNIDREVTISIGVSQAPSNGIDYISLYRKAAEALSRVKRAGKNDFLMTESDSEEKKKINTIADMQMVKSLITERRKPQGALKVEYDGFKHIYQFLTRYSDRTETDIEIVLFTLSRPDGNMIDPVTLSEAMFDLENIIKISLRIGDVATKYSSCQYLVMLIGAKDKDSVNVAERVVNNYKAYADKYAINIKFDTENVSSEELKG